MNLRQYVAPWLQGCKIERLDPFTMHKKFFWALPVCLALAGCGGGDIKPQITAIKVAALQYGRTATIYLGGADLRTTMQVDTGGACTSPSFASTSTPETAVLNCKVAQSATLCSPSSPPRATRCIPPR